MPNVQTKDFNVLIEGKSFFDMPIKNGEETYKLLKWKETLHEYFSKHYKLLAIDLTLYCSHIDPLN